MNADSIKIECEEDGFWLVIEAAETTVRWSENAVEQNTVAHIRLRIVDPEALYDHVKAAIGPWLRERDEARQWYGFKCAPEDVDESGGNDASDFYSIHADIWDNREGK